MLLAYRELIRVRGGGYGAGVLAQTLANAYGTTVC